MCEQHQWFCGQVEQHKTALYRLARSILRSDEDAEMKDIRVVVNNALT